MSKKKNLFQITHEPSWRFRIGASHVEFVLNNSLSRTCDGNDSGFGRFPVRHKSNQLFHASTYYYMCSIKKNHLIKATRLGWNKNHKILQPTILYIITETRFGIVYSVKLINIYILCVCVCVLTKARRDDSSSNLTETTWQYIIYYVRI